MRNDMRVLLFIVFLSGFFIQNGYSQNKEPLIRIGIIADIQYGDFETRGTRFYRNSLKKLNEAVNYFNDNNVAFTVNLGDLSDKYPEDIDTIVSILGGLDKRVDNITGNHDYAGIDNNEMLYRKLGMPAEYYTVELKKQNLVFIYLNTNEIASYANVKNTTKETELKAMREKIVTENRKNGYDWNGGISAKQMKWLEKTLAKADRKKQKAILFTHHPLYPVNNHNALNEKEILAVIEKYRCVKAVFSGHNHAGNSGSYNGIPCITLEGMIETENENSYGILEVYDNKLILNGNGRMKSHTLNYLQ